MLACQVAAGQPVPGVSLLTRERFDSLAFTSERPPMISTRRSSAVFALLLTVLGCSFAGAAQQQAYTAGDPRIQKVPVSLDGMCPLTAAEEGKLVPGKPEFQYLLGSHRYYFASKEQLLRFHESPQKKEWIPALCGLCPVSTRQRGNEVWGKPSFSVEFDGRRYWCADETAQREFEANPRKYAPVFGGDCAYCYVLEKVRVEGSWFFSTYVNDRLYLFPEQATLDKFLQSTDKDRYLEMDLVRNDPVEQKAGRTAPGNDEFTVTDHGFTYFFVSAANRDKFLENPAAFRQ